MPCKYIQRILLIAFELIGLPFNHMLSLQTGGETNLHLKHELMGFEDITSYEHHRIVS